MPYNFRPEDLYAILETGVFIWDDSTTDIAAEKDAFARIAVWF